MVHICEPYKWRVSRWSLSQYSKVSLSAAARSSETNAEVGTSQTVIVLKVSFRTDHVAPLLRSFLSRGTASRCNLAPFHMTARGDFM